MAREPLDLPPSETGEVRCAELPHEELARIWSGLQEAALTDNNARQFVEYFSADAARLFGAGNPRA